jgi:hypothetical protein
MTASTMNELEPFAASKGRVYRIRKGKSATCVEQLNGSLIILRIRMVTL